MNYASIYISRDERDGEPLRKEDGYTYELPDIPVSVELDCKQGEWEIHKANVTEEIKREDGSVLFSNGQAVTLSDDEKQNAIETVKEAFEAGKCEPEYNL